MKGFIIIIFYLFHFNVQAQIDCADLILRDSIEYYNNVPYTGVCEYYVRCIYLSDRRSYLNGKLNGTSIYWDKKGRKESEVEYKDGKMNGLFKYYFKNGNLRQTLEYQDGIQVGWWREYYKNGKIREETNYDAQGLMVDGIYYKWNKRGEKFMYKERIISHKGELGKLRWGSERIKYDKTRINK